MVSQQQQGDEGQWNHGRDGRVYMTEREGVEESHVEEPGRRATHQLPTAVSKPSNNSILVDPKRIKKEGRTAPPAMWRLKSWPTKLLRRLEQDVLPIQGWGLAVSESGFERVRIVPSDLQGTINWLGRNYMHAQLEFSREQPLAALRVRRPAQVIHYMEEVQIVRKRLDELYDKKLKWIRNKVTRVAG